TEDCPSIENPLDFENRFRKSIATQTTDISENEIGHDIEDNGDAASADNTDTNVPRENYFPTEEIENVTNPTRLSLEDYVSFTEMCDDATDQPHHPPITEDNAASAKNDSDEIPSTDAIEESLFATETGTNSANCEKKKNIYFTTSMSSEVARLYKMRKNTKCLTDPLSTAHLFVSAKTRLSTAIMEQNHQNGQEDAQQQPPTQIWETAAYDDWGLSAAQQYSLQVPANTPEAQPVDHSWVQAQQPGVQSTA
ncbi:Uncharacterized protein APZ42_020396, partial [Daphnia magna]